MCPARKENPLRPPLFFLCGGVTGTLTRPGGRRLHGGNKERLYPFISVGAMRLWSNALCNLAGTRRALLDGKSVQRGFAEFTLRERGKARRIKSAPISGRAVQKRLCDNVPVPLLSRPPSMTTARPSRTRACTLLLTGLRRASPACWIDTGQAHTRLRRSPCSARPSTRRFNNRFFCP
jgi:hypothetical protein